MSHAGDDPDAMWKPGYVPPTRDDDVAVAGVTEACGDARGDGDAGQRDGDGGGDGAEVLVWQPSRAVDDAPATPPAAETVAVPDTVGTDDVADDPWSPPVPALDELEIRVAGAPASPPDAPTTARPTWRRARVVALAAGVGAAVVAVAVVSIAADGGGSSAGAALPRVPDSVDVRWTVSLPGEHADVVSVDDLVVVASADRAARVAGLDAATGDERWSVRTGRADSLGELLVVGDVVLVTSVGRAPMIRALDPADGDEMWQRRVHADDDIAAFADSVAVIDHAGGRALRVVALDPLTGEPTGRLDDPTAKVGPAFVRVDGASVEAFDESLRRVAGPVDVDDAPFAVAVVGDVVVSAGSGRLRATELDGRERWVMDVGPDGVRALLPSGAEPTEVLLLSPGSITAVDTRGAEPVVRWSVTGGPVADPSVPGIRYLPMSAGAASPLLRIVDLRTGEVVSTIDAGASTGSPLVGADGLVLGRQVDADTWRLEGRAFRGGVSWTTELDGAPQLVDGGVVGLNATDGAIEMTYAGRG